MLRSGVDVNNNYTLAISDLSITKDSENCKLVAYWDATGKCWTIGWGHTGPDVHEGLVWTQFKADSQLLVDMSWAENAVRTLVKVALTRDQFISLGDFVYNVGSGNFASSTLLRDINACDMSDAAKEFLRWNESGGKVLPGLVVRRNAEEALFILGTDYTLATPSSVPDNSTVQTAPAVPV
jgi:lysozyme